MKTDAWLSGIAAPSETPATDAGVERSPLFDELVMMVDDEPLMTDLIQTHLEDAGYRNFVVTNEPADAMAMLRERDPGVLLLDLMMPGISGFDVLQQIRADETLRYTPVIVLTAATNAETKLRALNLGATDFLAKPVDESELVLRVRNTLAFRQYNRRLMFFDQTTGLPNRRQFERDVNAAVSRAQQSQDLTAVFSISVPEGRHVLETLGRSAADELAKILAARVVRLSEISHGGSRASRASEQLASAARLGSEQYGLLLGGMKAVESIEAIARNIVSDIAHPVSIDGHEVVPNAAVGISIAPADGDRAEALIMAAELARSQALQRGVARYEFFSQALNTRSLERLALGAQLRHATERGELRLHYQPKVDVATNTIIGVEALVRWQHPELGLVPPGRFIALAEELGLIGDIGDWVIRTACRDVADWNRSGLRPVKVAVNVSRAQFEGGRLETVVQKALADSGLPPAQLVVELTESMLMDDAPAALALMQRLKALGVVLSIDDFGTGYSSLSYLKRFPLDELKIDRSFITDLSMTADLAIARTIVTLGHNLSMKVVAEGVETGEQLDALRLIGCDVYQGFLFSKPVEPARLVERLRASA